MRELGLNNPALFPDVAFAHPGYLLLRLGSRSPLDPPWPRPEPQHPSLGDNRGPSRVLRSVAFHDQAASAFFNGVQFKGSSLLHEAQMATLTIETQIVRDGEP